MKASFWEPADSAVQPTETSAMKNPLICGGRWQYQLSRAKPP